MADRVVVGDLQASADVASHSRRPRVLFGGCLRDDIREDRGKKAVQARAETA